ncbi:hypothetical protein COCON_G00071210 [Conger conger]|uniref:3-ketoacyl-[acyl-carrier-protein] reductase beta subunit n=1 Tax=Conger conger TaxID=82655 RepID=A0A9Q1I4F8_CONCO|nr:hypothetical protein COCON_G00071210 [Conger conger]
MVKVIVQQGPEKRLTVSLICLIQSLEPLLTVVFCVLWISGAGAWSTAEVDIINRDGGNLLERLAFRLGDGDVRAGCGFGGSRGIGRAVSQLLAARGYRVAVVSRNLEAAQAAMATLPGAGHVALHCDVSKEQEVQEVFQSIQKTCGSLQYLINAAGINRDRLLLRTGQEDMVSVLHTNLLGPMLTCRAALRNMLTRQSGAIVNIGSVVGQKGNAGQCVYSASKAGLEGFTRSLAKEVASRNIRVNLLAPGFIRTDMTAGLQEEVLCGEWPWGGSGARGGGPGRALPPAGPLRDGTGAAGGRGLRLAT